MKSFRLDPGHLYEGRLNRLKRTKSLEDQEDFCVSFAETVTVSLQNKQEFLQVLLDNDFEFKRPHRLTRSSKEKAAGGSDRYLFSIDSQTFKKNTELLRFTVADRTFESDQFPASQALFEAWLNDVPDGEFRLVRFLSIHVWDCFEIATSY